MVRGIIKIATKRGVIRLEGEFFANEEVAQLATAIDSDFFDYETIQFETETGNFRVVTETVDEDISVATMREDDYMKWFNAATKPSE